MPHVTVTYFNVKGLGEGIRMLLAYGGQEFEDKRIAMEEWPDLKSKMPFGQVPLLEIDGKQYAQSLAIGRYLGHKYGLAGDNAEEHFLIDQNVDFFNDIGLSMKATFVPDEQGDSLKAKKHEELLKTHYRHLLSKLDEIIIENNGYLAAGKLTWADFMFAGLYEGLKRMVRTPDFDEMYPSFKKLRDTVVSLPKVKEYCEAAPKTEY